MYAVIIEIVSYIMFLIAGLLGLFDPKSLKDILIRREKLEKGLTDLISIREDWRKWGLPFPNSMDQVKAELAKTIAHEKEIRTQRKIMMSFFLVVGTVLLILSKLPALGINLFGN